jgi:hypothetical protein
VLITDAPSPANDNRLIVKIRCVIVMYRSVGHVRVMMCDVVVPRNDQRDDTHTYSDFGLSNVLDDGLLQTSCGTPDYVAPEVCAWGGGGRCECVRVVRADDGVGDDVR